MMILIWTSSEWSINETQHDCSAADSPGCEGGQFLCLLCWCWCVYHTLLLFYMGGERCCLLIKKKKKKKKPNSQMTLSWLMSLGIIIRCRRGGRCLFRVSTGISHLLVTGFGIPSGRAGLNTYIHLFMCGWVLNETDLNEAITYFLLTKSRRLSKEEWLREYPRATEPIYS